MRLIKVHAPNNKKRLLVYDTGNIIEVSLEHYANIEKEEYEYGGTLKDGDIEIKNKHVEVEEGVNIKLINITDGSSFNIQCSGSIDGGSKDNIDYKAYIQRAYS